VRPVRANVALIVFPVSSWLTVSLPVSVKLYAPAVTVPLSVIV
jgi:hypothetical protein